VNLAAKGKFQEALQLIKETSPFPSICGRICHHPCETDCNRSQIDESVAAHSIERFLADWDLNSNTRYQPKIKARKNEKVAIVGSGPAGLTCAYYLAQEGYPVTIFEKADLLGGMLTMAIPSYRLPREIVEAEIQLIRDLGVTMKTGLEIGKDKTIAQLREGGFRAFFVAIGAQECSRLGIEGEDLRGVYGGLDYLRRIKRGESLALGKDVVVIGGGNTAIDAARSARRSGSENAFILYRRGLEEMPARPEEIEECQEEGIGIQTLTQPVRFIGENGRVRAVECIKTLLADQDASGRQRPEPIPGSEFTIEVDAVITALGQEADWACLTPEYACTLTPWGTMKVDPMRVHIVFAYFFE
jgi:NADPH-dependent glutamate synthase beta subunit-like oxidoreductase